MDIFIKIELLGGPLDGEELHTECKVDELEIEGSRYEDGYEMGEYGACLYRFVSFC